MPRPLSLDLRRRVVSAVLEGATYAEAAERFGVGEASVSRLMRQHREKGDLTPGRLGGRRFGITDPQSQSVLRELVEEKPDRFVVELKELFEARTGRKTSESAIKRTLRKLGLKRKKKTLTALEQGTERVKKQRHEFQSLMPLLDANRLVFIDETGTQLGLARPHGRALRGELVHDQIPRNRGGTVTVLGGLTVAGLIASMTVDSGTDTEVFITFLEDVLLPELEPGTILIMDNLAAHHSKRVRETLVKWRMGVLYLPPYSPDLNPIEMAWAKLKSWLRTARAKTRSALDRAIGWGMTLITPADARNFIRHAGYLAPST